MTGSVQQKKQKGRDRLCQKTRQPPLYSRDGSQGVSALAHTGIFDLHCKTPDGTYFLVPLQKAKQKIFKAAAK
jgi:hypothetical protein